MWRPSRFMQTRVLLFLLAPLLRQGSARCQDTLDWAPGGYVPFDQITLQRSIARSGDVARFRPVLEKLSTKDVSVLVLFISDESAEEKGRDDAWSAIVCEWLTRHFSAKVTSSKLYISGVLSQHLEVIPASAEMIKPDLVFVEVSFTPLIKPTKYSHIDHTPRYLVAENFMRAILELSTQPPVVWLNLMERTSGQDTNEATYSLLTEYYKVPQASVRAAWAQRLPFPSSDLWQGTKLSQLGHKLVAVTLSNFMCHEFGLSCRTTKEAQTSLQVALFSHSLNLGNDLPENSKENSKDASTDEPGELVVPYCRQRPDDSLSPSTPEGSGSFIGAITTVGATTDGRIAWSLVVALAVVPLIMFQIIASFTGSSGVFLQNLLPQSMPELELLRVIATLNIVAWQYYQELPPAWSKPDNAIMQACREPYYDYPDWTRGFHKPCPDTWPCTWCRSGKYCFQFFFLLQSFVTTLNMVRAPSNPMWQYAQVWPMHALGLLISVIAAAPVNPLDLALTAVMAHGWITPFYSQLNGASWYLSALVGFWVLLPIWVRAADRLAEHRGISGVVAALAIVWFCTLTLPFLLWVWPVDFGLREVDPRMVVHNFVGFSPYTNWQPVAIGLLIAVLVMLGIEPRTQTAVLVCLLIPLLGLALVWFVVPSPGFTMGKEFLLVEKGFVLQPLFALLMLGCLGARNFPNRVHEMLTGPCTLWFAKLCWPIFILHQPVHRLCTKFIFPQLVRFRTPPPVYMALYPLVLLLVSVVASRLVERPWAMLLYRLRNRGTGETKQNTNGRNKEDGSMPGYSYEKASGVKPFDPNYFPSNGYQRR